MTLTATICKERLLGKILEKVHRHLCMAYEGYISLFVKFIQDFSNNNSND